jgi:hypothetical protein
MGKLLSINPGMTFGRLSVVSFAGINRSRKRTFTCLCECGNVVKVTSSRVYSGRVISCGCYQKEQASKANHKHGQTRTAIYERWKAMWQRCVNPNNKRWKHYGGRGISVCDRWKKFENFLADMGQPPKGLSIDRINNDGNYEPANCRWATAKQQRINSSKKHEH